MVIKFQDIKEKALKNPNVKSFYDELEPEFKLAREITKLRETTGLTQREFSVKAGIKQPQLARLESGKQLPRLETLVNLAVTAGYSLEVRFIPKTSTQETIICSLVNNNTSNSF